MRATTGSAHRPLLSTPGTVPLQSLTPTFSRRLMREMSLKLGKPSIAWPVCGSTPSGSALTRLRQRQLHFDGPLDGLQVRLGQSAQTVPEADLAHRRQLVSHGLVLPPAHFDQGL